MMEFTLKSFFKLGREIVRVTSAGEVIIQEDATIEELRDVTKKLALLVSQHYIGATICQKDSKNEKLNPEM